VTTWLICGAVAAVLGFATWGLARASSREMPPYEKRAAERYSRMIGDHLTPEERLERSRRLAEDAPVRHWQPDPSRFGRCPSCGTLRPLDDGLIAAHDRPEPQVPFNVQSFPCRGAGSEPIAEWEWEFLRNQRTKPTHPETPAPPGTPDPRGVGKGLAGDAPMPG
jgi:hypothetical protein